MVDIPATAAPQPTPSPTTPTTIVTPVEATVSNVPDKIQQLLRQIQVNATVAQLPGDGTLTLNSAIGSLTVLLPVLADAKQQQLTQQLINLLQSQKPLTVVVQPGNPPTQAFLLLPQPPSAMPPALNAAPATTIIENNILFQTINQPRQPLTVGLALPAIVLPPNIVVPGTAGTTPQVSLPISSLSLPITPSAVPLAPVTNPQPEAVNNLLPGEIAFQATVKAEQAVTQTQLPTIPQPATQNSLPIQTVTPQNSTPPLAPPIQQTSTTAPILQPGSEIMLRVDAVYPPPRTEAQATTSAALPPPPGSNQIIATAVGNGPNGQLILKAGEATLYVKQTMDVPVGTSLLLTVEQPKISALPINPDSPSFNSLQQAMTTLTQIDPQLARAVMENHIPQPTAALPGALLFLMSAFKQGSVRTWLGDDAIEALTRAGKFELLAKLAEDLTSAGQTTRDTVVGEWRAYPLPMQLNQQFQILNLYVHDQGQGKFSKNAAEKTDKSHTRFLIDVRMSKLGAMQLDGFIQTKKLDMMVRSEQPLPNGLHQELRATYLNALGAIDYAGSLNFQVGRQHWLVPQKAATPATITT